MVIFDALIKKDDAVRLAVVEIPFNTKDFLINFYFKRISRTINRLNETIAI